VLTPQEVEELYAVMGQLREDGRTFIFISHKLHEVMRITDRVTVLRDGRVVGTVKSAETNDRELARMMVGREVVLRVQKLEGKPGPPMLRVEGLSATDYRKLPAVRNVSFEVREGEIVGIAGIEGNGQTELVEVLTGLRKASGGAIFLDGQEITSLSPAELLHRGLAHIPEDRHRRGLIMDFTIAENAVLGFQDDPPFVRGPQLLMRKVYEFAQMVVRKFDVRTPTVRAAAKTLSGGNQQKLIVGREFERRPRVLIAAQPTRGLDVGATEFVHQQLLNERQAGKGVLLVSLELSEIMSLSDRILVMYEGQIVGTSTPDEATEEGLGLMMAGGRRRPSG
jgi:simple sugar transport system ATP-binding protein